MKIYFEIIGISSLLYYFIISFYTKKWNSTFALFWLAAGIIHSIAAMLSFSQNGKSLLLVSGVFFWLVFLSVEVVICCAMLKNTKKALPYIIVLGAQVRGTKITNSLKRRLDAALLYLKKNPDTCVIVSGGQGPKEALSEAAAMAGYLQIHGIDRARIVLEDTSTSTWENLRNSSKIIGDLEQPVGVVTNNFHIYRALQIGKQIGFSNINGISATSNPVLQVNYMVREFFAVIWMRIRFFIT
jgi:uncharacterized SAM-binding protein YcdF (DUF218 family)